MSNIGKSGIPDFKSGSIKASQRVGESGCRGVQWDRQVNKWKVRLNINGKRRYFGHYASLEGAIERAQNASQENTA
jgi:hypothetical protein